MRYLLDAYLSAMEWVWLGEEQPNPPRAIVQPTEHERELTEYERELAEWDAEFYRGGRALVE